MTHRETETVGNTHTQRHSKCVQRGVLRVWDDTICFGVFFRKVQSLVLGFGSDGRDEMGIR